MQKIVGLTSKYMIPTLSNYVKYLLLLSIFMFLLLLPLPLEYVRCLLIEDDEGLSSST